MATVYAFEKLTRENVPPVVGAKYWWYKTDRVLLVLTILETTYDPKAVTWGVKLRWDHYMGLVVMVNPEYTGEVVWDNHDWNAAHLKEYVPPVQEKDLAPDEELCNGCRGMYYETERDLEILGCWWCGSNMPGRKKKSLPSPPGPSRKSPLHPLVPHQK